MKFDFSAFYVNFNETHCNFDMFYKTYNDLNVSLKLSIHLLFFTVVSNL